MGRGNADDSRAVQAAIDEAAAKGGADIHVPPGIYRVRGLRLRSNVRLLGAGRDRTVMRETSGTSYLLSVNPGKEGFADLSQNQHDIEIAHIAFEGPVAAMGFAEHQHLLNFNGVTRLHVRDCAIRGFRGDGIYLGSGNVAGLERHNVDVCIAQNEFDGVNHDNRNGISVIDGEGVAISKNVFVRCSRSTMPGPIDIEPDGHPFQRVRDIAIEENRFEDCGGNVAKISIHIPVPEAFGGSIGNFRITKNVVAARQHSGDALYVRIFYAGRGTPRRVAASDVEVLDNVLAHGKAVLQGIDGFLIKGNAFAGHNGGLTVGAIRADQPDTADRGTIALNTFHQPSGRDAALVIGRARRLNIIGNRFRTSDRLSASGPAVMLAAGGQKPLFEGLTLDDNVFADEYEVHLVSKAPAATADVRVLKSNRTFRGMDLAIVRLRP